MRSDSIRIPRHVPLARSLAPHIGDAMYAVGVCIIHARFDARPGPLRAFCSQNLARSTGARADRRKFPCTWAMADARVRVRVRTRFKVSVWGARPRRGTRLQNASADDMVQVNVTTVGVGAHQRRAGSHAERGVGCDEARTARDLPAFVHSGCARALGRNANLGLVLGW